MIQARSAARARAVAGGARCASSTVAAWGGGAAVQRVAAAQALRRRRLLRRRAARTVRLHNLQELDHHLRSVASAGQRLRCGRRRARQRGSGAGPPRTFDTGRISTCFLPRFSAL